MSGARRWMRLYALALGLLLLACDNPAPPVPTRPTPTMTATPAPTGTPTLTPVPTATPSPTLTPLPTSTPAPTATPVPTATAGPERTPVGGTAGPELMTALGAMDAAPSYRYALTLTVGLPEARYVLTGTGRYAAPATYDTMFNNVGFSTEVLTLGDSTYVRSYGVWHRGEPDAVLFPSGAPPNVGRLLGLLTYAVDAAPAADGSARLDGRPARHLFFHLPAGGPLANLSRDLGQGGDLWVDPESRRFERLMFALGPPPAGPNTGTLQLDFMDYGAAIVLTPPAVP